MESINKVKYLDDWLEFVELTFNAKINFKTCHHKNFFSYYIHLFQLQDWKK
jgi:hypothetical protein